MEKDLNAAVADFRRRLEERGSEKQRLQGLVIDLESTDEASAQAGRSLRRARADLARAENRLAALAHDYAHFRLREAVGHDPGHLDEATFDKALLSISSGRGTRHETRSPRDGHISFATFRSLLLADLPLGQLLENLRGAPRTDVILDLLQDETDTKNILRHWAAMTQSDPYVSDILHRAAAATRRFGECLTRFSRGLDSLRINYELKQRKVDHLAFTISGSRPAIEAANYWENIEQVCSDEVRDLLNTFLGMEQARDELRHLRDALNDELRAFIATFIPRYVTYATRQSWARREGLGARRLPAGRLCDYLLEENERTDYLLPGTSGMTIDVPSIPRNIRAFRQTSSFRRYRRSLQQTAMADASTVADSALHR